MDDVPYSAEREEALAHLLEGQGLTLDDGQTIRRRRGPGNPPLSFAQQRLWFLDQLEPQTATYNIAVASHLPGPLDAKLLERCLSELVIRHEALRTVFSPEGARPSQVIEPARPMHLKTVDLSDLPETEREAAGERLLAKEARVPFDLARGPLFRALLVRRSDQDHVLLLTMHHIVSDGWSMGVLCAELSALYEAYSAGRQARFAELPIQYADFAVWQRQWLQGQVLQSQLAYWKDRLGSELPILEMPTDRPRPAVRGARGAVETGVLPPALVEGLEDLSRREGVTTFMTLLAGFLTLLHRYSGQDDIVVGSPIANRNHSEIEGLIGFFVNTLVLRTDLSGEPSFRELLGRVRGVALGAYDHQDLPFEKLVEELRPKRDSSRIPLVQVVLAFQKALPASELAMSGARSRLTEVHTGTSKFDLNVALRETEQGLVDRWEYDTELFDASTIRRLRQHFLTLLQGAVADPTKRLAELPLLAETERHQLLVQWNDTQTEYRRDKYVHQEFEAQVERSPDAVALTYQDQSLTYGELNRRANRLAHYLQSMGVRPEVRVGLCLERSAELVIGILGILKAGGAYVPLDPEYPSQRLEFMLKDAQASVVVTQSGCLDRLPQAGAQVVCLDTAGERIARQSETNAPMATTPQNMAYVIYTSGSTGRPKGVAVTHGNLARLFTATQDWFSFDHRDVWTLFHSSSFDFSVWEIWGALVYGGRLVVVPHWVTRSPDAFHQLLRTERVTVLNHTPSAFQRLMRADQEASGDAKDLAVRLVIFGGESLEPQQLKPWFDKYGDATPRLVNMYGITETTVHVTYRPVDRRDTLARGGSPIGRPIPDLRTYVLDRHGNPVPVGVVGELCIGGAGVARGYLNRADITADRFVPDPFSGEPGARLYRSGDLARYLPDGNLEFRGRADHQVKVRGFRIELGEVESRLVEHPGLRQAVVSAREDAPGDKRLVAYIVPRQDSTPTVSELREFLSDRLPNHMVPSAFVFLEALPLTSTGKIDRRALPAPETTRPELEDSYVAPRTPDEKALAAIWSRILGIDRVGVHDNFFALGGDSIRSIQVLAEARKCGLHFPLQQLFQAQTVSRLAGVAGASRAESSPGDRTAPFGLISPTDRQRVPKDVEDAYPLTMLQAGMLFHLQYTPESCLYHNVNSVSLRVPFHQSAFQQAAQRMVARHAALRTSFDLTRFSEPLQLVHQTARIEVVVEDIRHLPYDAQEGVIDAWMEREKHRHFDISRPPLLRFHIYRRTDDMLQLGRTDCHAILDGWSVQFLMAELWRSYFALIAGEEPPPDTPPAGSFRDCVAAERQALESEEAARYWDRKLEDSSLASLPRWPSSYRSTDPLEVRFPTFRIDAQTFESLQDLARSAGLPLKSLLLAAHLKVLSTFTGQDDVVTGLVTHVRPEERDGGQVCGLFLNTLPFRLRLQGCTWLELARQTFEAERDFLPYRCYPMARIQQRRGRQKLFQYPFVYLHFHETEDLLRTGKLHQAGGLRRWAPTEFPFLVAFVREPTPTGLRLVLHYSPSQLCQQQIDSLVSCYSSTLEAIATDPSARHDLFSPLSEREHHQLMVEWNDTATDYPRELCVHQLFEEQVKRTPDAIALVFGEEHLSYGELNRRANQLARQLGDLGVGPEVCVGLFLERSIELVVGILGILKAGGAYVPLDPGYPKQRLAFMLADVQAPVIVTHVPCAERLPESTARLVHLDTDVKLIAEQTDANPASGTTAENLAYVMYTSGSTGRPKGVMMCHGSLSNLVAWQQRRRGFSRGATVLQFASSSFDVSFQEIFSTWCSGGKLVLITEEVTRDPVALWDVIREQAVERLFVPFVALQQLAEALHDQETVSCGLSEVITAGEQLKMTEPIVGLLEKMSGVTLQNQYGPTEAHVVTEFAVDGQQCTLPPIGRPIANNEMYVLNARLQPVPIGVTGELYIGGVGLARGYHDRPGLTAEKFIPHPFSDLPGARLYRTGDLGRYLPDGNLEFLGRTDHQVKVRGFRIELGEIEAVLGHHPAVREAAVLAREGASGDKRLVAYLACTESISTLALRRFLKERLPEYMIPARFCQLDALPRTPTGKLDRARLPEPDEAPVESGVAFTAARTSAERAIAEIWRQALELERVGVHDNFLDLGGHSLMAIRVVAQIQKQLKVQVRPSQLFLQTLAQLAAGCEQQMEDLPPDGDGGDHGTQ